MASSEWVQRTRMIGLVEAKTKYKSRKPAKGKVDPAATASRLGRTILIFFYDVYTLGLTNDTTHTIRRVGQV